MIPVDHSNDVKGTQRCITAHMYNVSGREDQSSREQGVIVPHSLRV
jgi:hypothetical protein